ncbi:2-oxoglutarate dehydrogenase complex dihydrolipoyllysine-residue succinyltransferase [Arcicella aquatica]|uniref:Dihydrolipoyllysine-residue succinyltransferase component of 2-oxoglutarate dehydrogenase complex n=1 Tax=Arcicella aquatica TaxID=217141 RepID=A0ABU5QML8_9BACT|nr:2-oxoglutarate dehydrogenase complex dihydrolipoyllysine-residue succinyltransferase [Arcicella aquatica]MEA5258258.1 2-oxoglutarate dehydrogenase complex dihydrolipoyllysine-residue succinyltransferase [Arcicella aquatica]
MAIEMKVPPVGESITEVTIAAWNKKDGDTVKMDEVLCELESDKATFELPAEAEGVLKIVAKEGDTLPIGAVICIIETVGGQTAATPAAPAPTTEAPATPAAAPAASTEAPKTIEIKVPSVGESITEVTVSSWNKKEGDSVNMDEVLCELESDKATFELPAEATGTLHIVAEAGTTLPIGGIVATITIGAGQAVAASAPAAAPAAPEAPASSASTTSYAAGHASPAAAKALAEKGIDPANVQGSGVGGRITKEDAQSAQKPVAAPTPAPAKAAEPAPVAAPSTSGRGERTEKMTSLRKTVARRLVQVKNETAMLTTFNEVDMKPIMDLRGKYKDKFKEKHGVGLGFMSFFTKAVCVALKEFPAVNASIDGDSIVYHDFCDISIAVSAPKGLVVPVIRNAEQLSLAGIESEVIRLALKARDNKLTLPEMTGGTFTITNGGVFGSMLSTPIINAPQSAILGMHNIVERAVVVGGQIVVRPIMYIALSYDHRIIDGRESVSFLVRVKQLLEDPTRLLLDV